MFDVHCEAGLYAPRFHLLNHVVEDLERSGSWDLVNISAFEQFIVHIKRAYMSMLQRRDRAPEGTVGVVNATAQEIRAELVSSGKEKRRYIVEK